MTTTLYLLELQDTPILEQLRLEEVLLRTDERNVCLINTGSPRAIVMGLSQAPEELLDLERVARDSIPVYKRFSGGGTVIVDESTLFVTLLFGKKSLPISPYPEPILQWTAELYREAWNLSDFSVRENDYTLALRKCGGNAQYLRKERWLHHTSFLWDYRDENMNYLLLPKKRPAYREGRSHGDFLCRLKDVARDRANLIEGLKTTLAKRFDLEPLPLEEAGEILSRPHRQATHVLQ